jgi:hypothetical protein
MRAQFSLRNSDLHSETWVRLRKHLASRLNELRNKNDADLTPTETASLRGRIAEIKSLLALDKVSPPVVDDHDGIAAVD